MSAAFTVKGFINGSYEKDRLHAIGAIENRDLYYQGTNLGLEKDGEGGITIGYGFDIAKQGAAKVREAVNAVGGSITLEHEEIMQ